MEDWAVVYLTWKDLFGVIPKENEVLEVIQRFNRQSTAVLLSRLGIQLFLDQARRNTEETIYLQSFLVANFWDDDVLNRAKEKFPTDRLSFRRAFHLQQILTLLKWTVIHGRSVGGIEPDKDQKARFELGRCMLKTSDLLLSVSMRGKIADARKTQSLKRYLRAQLQMGAGFDINNPPPVPNAVARSETIFGEILKHTPTSIDLSSKLKEQTSISLDSYVDLTLGTLANFLSRKPKDLIENPALSIINPNTIFGVAVPQEQNQKFWEMESSTLDECAKVLSAPSELVPQQDFTAFRMKPFLLLDTGNVVCVNPGFVQEKLEIGLFWTIANNLQGDDRKNAFDTWGKLFETYVNQTLKSAVDPAKERYATCPEFTGKKYQHEAFDGILLSGRLCAVLECKGGFLPNNAKYAENLTEFETSLNKKFGTDPHAGIEQLTRKIGRVFARDTKIRRQLEGVDISTIDIVIPVLVVQETFVSSFFTLPWLAKTFRDSMRKQALDRRLVVMGLLVLHVEDVERLSSYVKAGSFTLGNCLLDAAKRGDPGPNRLFTFTDLLREFLEKNKINRISGDDIDKKFREVLDRLCLRLFDRKFEGGEREQGGPSKST